MMYKPFINKLYFFFAFSTYFVQAMNIKDLEQKSMLYQSKEIARRFSGKSIQWRHPYGLPKTKALLDESSVWFTSYASSTLTDKDQTFWEYLGSDKLWRLFKEIGINGIHLGPMKVAGQILREDSSSTDGGFDPIGFGLDDSYGSLSQYLAFIQTTKKYRSIVIGDLIPGHTGRGYDFTLALMDYKDYPGIYHMVEIPSKDWHLLPDVPSGQVSQNLSISEVEKLKENGYIVGRLQRVLFYSPKYKQTNWDATKEWVGIDGKTRRWVYLHYFKENQPSLNWLDPSFAANRILAADMILSIQDLHQKVLRLDSNAYLGVEITPESKQAFSEMHPLSDIANHMLAMMIRKFGGYSFQELNLPLKEIKDSLELGCELSYDFLLRAACLYSLATQTSELLKLCYQRLLEEDLQPMQFVHALQNHDEINLEFIEFKYSRDKYPFFKRQYSGSDLMRKVLDETIYPLFDQDYRMDTGLCTTIADFCAQSLSIHNPYQMSSQEIEQVKKMHLLFAFFSAMQPGVFAISGWDLVGALPIETDFCPQDDDKRWLNRGSYDLLGRSCESPYHLSKAYHLYGPIPKQLKNPASFVSKLKGYLKARKDYVLSKAYFLGVVPTNHPAILATLYSLAGNNYLQMSLLNFSRKPICETIELDSLANTNAINILTRKNEKKRADSTQFTIQLDPLEGKVIVFEPSRY